MPSTPSHSGVSLTPAIDAPTGQESALDILGVLAAMPIFSNVGTGSLSAIAAGAEMIRLKKGAVLFRQGDMPTGFYLVIEGQIKLAFTATRGAEKVISLRGPQQSFGEAVMFADKPYPVYTQAIAESRLLRIPREPVFELLDRDPEVARRMLAGLSMRLHAMVLDVEAYSLRSSAERLIGFLLQSAGTGEEVAEGRVEIDLPASKLIIASRLNVTPETLSRVQHDLIEAGLISVQGRHIVIHDVRRLREYRP
ncbi:MAG: Global nitrogen regulator [Gammaproteobacteria bacterium]|nr:Global nitrogen regulator [Gammaproteobacteria bacterium]